MEMDGGDKQESLMSPQESSKGPVVMGGEWKTPLLSCGDGPAQFLFAWCCPCFALAGAREEFDGTSFLFNCLCLHPILGRNMIREGYDIPGGCCGDICVATMCEPCSVVQIIQEVKARGKLREPNPMGAGQWSSSLFGCGECCMALFFPCIQTAQARTMFDGSGCCFNCMCTPTPMIRNQIREGYGIQGTWVEDVLVSLYCTPCTSAQMMREVKKQVAAGNTKPSGATMT